MTEKNNMENLPRACFSVLPSSGELILIKRGERQYTPFSTKEKGDPRIIATEMNEAMGVTRAQEEVMLNGAMFGWEIPAVGRDRTDENGLNSEVKQIQFIDSNYNELFRIPDGGSIIVTRPEGEIYPGVQEEWVGICKHIDEAHTNINGVCFHICQFAEKQERIGATYKPEENPEYVGSYRVTQRLFVGDKIFKQGHNPNAPQPHATWQSYKGDPDRNDFGHYFTDKSDAIGDLLRRSDAERTGKPYDFSEEMRQKNRDRQDER